jgi:hypothetical protein
MLAGTSRGGSLAAGRKEVREQILDLRPVYYRLEERIRAHVLLCWLALLLIRIAETSTGQTWPAIRRELDASTWAPSPALPALPPAHRAHQARPVMRDGQQRSQPYCPGFPSPYGAPAFAS